MLSQLVRELEREIVEQAVTGLEYGSQRQAGVAPALGSQIDKYVANLPQRLTIELVA